MRQQEKGEGGESQLKGGREGGRGPRRRKEEIVAADTVTQRFSHRKHRKELSS